MNYSQDINNKYLANKGRGSGGRSGGGDGGVVRQSLIIWFLQIYHHNYFRY